MADEFGGIPIGEDHVARDEFGGIPISASGNPSSNGSLHPDGSRSVVSSPNAGGLSWSDVPGTAISNLGSSAWNTAKAIATPFEHPVDTFAGIANVIGGESGKLVPALATVPGTKAADAVNSYFSSRYGSVEGFKNAVATDPVGVMTDLSAAFTGGETLGAKLPGIAGKAAKISGDVGRAINPLTAPARVAAKVAPLVPGADTATNFIKALPGNAAAKFIGDVTTGAGSKSLKQAYQAGVQGGDVGATFTGNMRGNIPWSNVVSDAKAALGNMFAERSARYRSGMAEVSGDQSILDYKPIDDAISNMDQVKVFKGKDLSPNTADVRQNIKDALSDWKKGDPENGISPEEYQTPEGFDALKQKIGDIKDSQQHGSPQWTIASNVYNAVRKTIADQAPVYNKVMGDYSAASDQLSELQKELSLGKKGNPNTALRKLQSVMRDNANTSFGNRAKLAETLDANSKTPILPALAGQALSTEIPRGLAKYVDIGMMGAAGLAHLPAALAIGAISSPRLMGEAAYGLGAARRGLSPYASAAMAKVNPGAAALTSYEASKPATLADYNQSPWGQSAPAYMTP